MQKYDVPYLVFGILITAVASCRSATENNPSPPLEPEWSESATVSISETTSETPVDFAGMPTEPPPPLPLPTADDWQSLGSDRTGLSLSIPPDWINFTDQVNMPTMDNRLGINLHFATDSERTGRSLLAGKSFDDGAYISGLIVLPPASAVDPATALVEMLASAAPSAVRLSAIRPIISANDVDGFMVDVGDGPVGLNVAGPHDLRTRVALFVPETADSTGSPAWIILLLSASSGRWDQSVELFDRVLQSARVFDVRPGVTAQEGNVVVRGELEGDRDLVSVALTNGVNDLWTFTTAGNRYASIFLRPEEPQLDLTLTLLGPDRQTVAYVENGYAGVTESATDVLLTQPGVYLVEVSDFFRDSGRYTLSLVLSDQPQYSGGGPIDFGQALQGELPAGGQHYWVFTGAARQRVSIVVDPGAPSFDAILELYGPGGRQLVALDEGFSGDPEVISGFELPTAGEYAVLVRSFSAGGGAYTVSLDEGDQPIANFYDAGDLMYGEVRRESLQRQEAHAWFLAAKAGDHILIRITPLSAHLDPDVWLLDGNVERIAAVDSFAAGEPETIELTIQADGQYIVLVRDFNGESGDYEIALGAAPAATPETAGSLSYGDTIIGMVKPGTATAWTFNAQAGDVINVIIQAADSSSDIVLALRGPDGLTALEVDENSAGGGESIASFVVPVSGPWQIVLRDFFGDEANYRLSLERAQ